MPIKMKFPKVWPFRIDHPLDTCSSWCLYFSIRSRIASSRRSFWRKSNWAASILISLSRSTSKVVLYIFLIPLWKLSSCRSIGNYKINFNKKGRFTGELTDRWAYKMIPLNGENLRAKKLGGSMSRPSRDKVKQDLSPPQFIISSINGLLLKPIF